MPQLGRLMENFDILGKIFIVDMSILLLGCKMFVVSISKELEVLSGLFKIGLVREPEYSFAREVLENRKGEV